MVLIVFDEAHKAIGKYAYVQIMNYLENLSIGYRVLGLSATPGNNASHIQVKKYFFNIFYLKEVIQNLRISKLEVRDENDADVKKYAF